jgi:hypothetical protein
VPSEVGKLSGVDVTIANVARMWDYYLGGSENSEAEREAAQLGLGAAPGHADDFHRLGRGYEHEGITLKGIVGLELKARGLDVDLNVCQDKDYFDAHAVILVTSPGCKENANICVTDDGCLTRMRDYWGDVDMPASEPDFCGWINDPAGVAAAVVETVTRAMSYLRPGSPV